MSDQELFDRCRKKLWEMLSKVDFLDGCKSYEGAIDVGIYYPNYFESEENTIPAPCLYTITLHCYVLGPARHYTFKGKTMREALQGFERWLEDNDE